ncbi:TrpB-like pyridoxal-phosphate dependent enzyme [Candidatus Endobugula sertula]|uniref:tryptophan synthase n=1 Tax=Candidatus Endobugula sertula TaxID=62101 RepID=A0A1D2QPE5_9GAMM|nr:TrpB-like pyridoxal-phosphate dependent enzyme [Candidatus Endobugula sertula]
MEKVFINNIEKELPSNTLYLSEKDVPTHWFNLIPELPFEIPKPIHNQTELEVKSSDFDWMYAAECLKIELQEGRYGTDSRIEIPQPIYKEHVKYRSTPLVRAHGLERHLDFSGEIYYKREDLNPGGSHKYNTALAQAYYGHIEGTDTLVTDTGAGQWGAALSLAGKHFDMKTIVFMIKKSFDEKPYRRYLMKLLDAEVISSPSTKTTVGQEVLKTNPDNTGSLGIGMSEAIELVRNNNTYKLALGCMSYFAVLHQTVIGLELKRQLEMWDVVPDSLIGCIGGGSNFMGFTAPFVKDKLDGQPIDLIAAESKNVPCMTKGKYAYDWADYNKLTPKIKMYTLGHDFIPPAIHSGGLRYHGKTPVLSALVHHDLVEPRAFVEKDVLEACRLFFQTEHVLPAPESGHAILATIQEALAAKSKNQAKKIVFCLSGHGYLDLQGYANHAGL